MPLVVALTFANATGTCACLNGRTVFLTNVTPTSWQAVAAFLCGDTTTITLLCTGIANWNLVAAFVGPLGCSWTATVVSFQCDPLYIPFIGFNVIGCCTGTVDAYVTE